MMPSHPPMKTPARSLYKVGSRQSVLALAQTQLAIDRLKYIYPEIEFQIIKMTTNGDKVQNVALSKMAGRSVFTKELEEALLNGDVDFVVHSLKDMATRLPESLVIGSIFNRINPYDVVLMAPHNRGKTLSDLSPDSLVGTSALRRVAVLKRKYPHLRFESVRGNLNTRLAKLDGTFEYKEGSPVKYDALILAEAGVKRLGWEDRIDEVLSDGSYAVGQGALACECREGDLDVLSLLSLLHEEASALSCVAERSLMRYLQGGCSTPVGVRTTPFSNAEFPGPLSRLTLEAEVLSYDGSQIVSGCLTAPLPFELPFSKSVSSDAAPKPPPTMPGTPVGDTLSLDFDDDEKKAARDPAYVILGLNVQPMCPVARVRLARASRLGCEVAKSLIAQGAEDILVITRKKPEAKSGERSKQKRKAFYRRCAAGEERAKRRALNDSRQAALAVGTAGFLATFERNRERESTIELYRLLRDAESVLTPETDDAVQEASDEDDVLTALKQESKEPTKRHFNRVKLGVKNCLFVASENPSLSPGLLVDQVFRTAERNRMATSKHLLRLLPVMTTCRAELDDIQKTVATLWKSFLLEKKAEKEHDLDCRHLYALPEERQFLAAYKARQNDTLQRVDVLNAAYNGVVAVSNDWKVGPTEPTILIWLNCIRNLVCISLLERNEHFCKYNLQEFAAKVSQPETTKTNTATQAL